MASWVDVKLIVNADGFEMSQPTRAYRAAAQLLAGVDAETAANAAYAVATRSGVVKKLRDRAKVEQAAAVAAAWVAAEAVAAKAAVQVPRPEAPASARSDLSSAREPKLCLSQVAKTHAAEMAELKRRLAELEWGAQ